MESKCFLFIYFIMFLKHKWIAGGRDNSAERKKTNYRTLMIDFKITQWPWIILSSSTLRKIQSLKSIDQGQINRRFIIQWYITSVRTEMKNARYLFWCRPNKVYYTTLDLSQKHFSLSGNLLSPEILETNFKQVFLYPFVSIFTPPLSLFFLFVKTNVLL